MFEWFRRAKGNTRADEGRGERWDQLESRVQAIEAKLDAVNDLPIQWATTTQQLRRMVGHISKTNALDARPHEVPQSPPPPPKPLTQDEVISKIHREQSA